MNRYSKSSLKELSTCHKDLQTIFKFVLPMWDHKILCGTRGKKAQNEAYKTGKSTKHYPYSKHNTVPSLAVDVQPYPIDWKDTERMTYFAGFIMGIVEILFREGKITHHLRWGGDWDQDGHLLEETFRDWGHFEIIGK